ncbi:MAG: SsrA-binding protein SmpB [Acidimicrobiia bacterium]|nr:SsrA-binding protein SmpB [Acidimicrobiia bacterium]MDH5421971.1 SsrA-binding protein SmpB [Acidimicrobiia bacterium]MDH5502912.1 SsrA-binding protein SmpB [Acidimicrobiia bacterium]
MTAERVLVTQNRKARHDYSIVDTFEAGMVLLGSEVKSLRAKTANLQDAFVIIENGEAFLLNAYIAPYSYAHDGGHATGRKRKLLLNRREIERIAAAIAEQGVTAIPISIYFLGGKAKVEVALGKGRKAYDKRQALKEKDQKREMQRSTGRATKNM